jgi:hypothetical protein
MKSLLVCMLSITSLYYASSLCMNNTKLPKKSQKINVYKQPNAIESTMIILLEKSNDVLKSISKDNSYSLEELRNWYVPLSLVNKTVLRTAQRPKFIKALITTVAYDNDHYNEGDIAQVLNTRGARIHMKHCARLFNPTIMMCTLRSLKRNGADFNYRKPYACGGDTPLTYLIRQQQSPLEQSLIAIHQLLHYGARLDHYADIDPLSLSIKLEQLDIFYALIKYYDETKNDLYYPLRYAIEKYATTPAGGDSLLLREKYQKCIITLLEKNADATEGLIYAIEQGYLCFFLIRTCIKYNADPNETFKKFMDYVFTHRDEPQSYLKNMVDIFKKSPQFKQEENSTFLEHRAACINTISDWIS